MSENFYQDAWDDHFPIDYDTSHSLFLGASILFGCLWSIMPIAFALSGNLVLVEAQSNATPLSTWCWSYLGILCLTVGSIIMTKYSQDAGIAHQYDYLGPMRVKDLRIYQRQVVLGCNTYNGGTMCGGSQGLEDCCFYHEYAVKVELEWGYEWACRRHQYRNKLCTSTDTYEPCTTVACKSKWPNAVCETSQLEKAEIEARLCAEMLYRTDLRYPTKYNPQEAPGHDWPTWLAFGDCSTCTSRFIVPSDGKIRHLKYAGCLFLVIGLGIWIVILLKWLAKCLARGRQQAGHCGGEDETPLLQPTHDYGSSYSHTAMGQETVGGAAEYNLQNAVYSPDFDY